MITPSTRTSPEETYVDSCVRQILEGKNNTLFIDLKPQDTPWSMTIDKAITQRVVAQGYRITTTYTFPNLTNIVLSTRPTKVKFMAEKNIDEEVERYNLMREKWIKSRGLVNTEEISN